MFSHWTPNGPNPVRMVRFVSVNEENCKWHFKFLRCNRFPQEKFFSERQARITKPWSLRCLLLSFFSPEENECEDSVAKLHTNNVVLSDHLKATELVFSLFFGAMQCF
ncbi:hypothetical protein CRENBAI_002576 [Crenichthys baileyi]|uniref:Uncharacterized protein n=1 Tax=Crenichthys baileyi TaxID=28760 RepID=A0AAV9RVT3_9TELE